MQTQPDKTKPQVSFFSNSFFFFLAQTPLKNQNKTWPILFGQALTLTYQTDQK